MLEVVCCSTRIQDFSRSGLRVGCMTRTRGSCDLVWSAGGLLPLGQCAKKELSEFFPGLDLGNVDIQIRLPLYVEKGMAGFTLGNTVYIDPAYYSQGSVNGLAPTQVSLFMRP